MGENEIVTSIFRVKNVISKSDDSERQQFERLADFVNGKIKEYRKNTPSFKFPNIYRVNLSIKDKKYFSSCDEGCIVCWNWRVVPDFRDETRQYAETVSRSIIDPIQIIVMPNIGTISDLVDTIEKGCDINFITSSVLIVFTPDNYKYGGFLLKKEDFDGKNSIMKLKDTVVSYPWYTFDKTNMVSISDYLFYYQADIGKPETYKRNKRKILKQKFLHSMQQCSAKSFGLINKKEWRKFTEFIKTIPDKTFVQRVMGEFNYSEEQARNLITEFTEKIDTYIDGKNIENEMLEALINRDSELNERYRRIFEDEWIKSNKVEIEESKAACERAVYQERLKREQISSLNNAIEEAENRLSEINAQIKEREILIKEVEDNISARLTKARSNISEFISEFVFYQNTPQPVVVENTSNETNKVVCAYKKGKCFAKEEPESINELKDFIDILSDNLQSAGVLKTNDFSFDKELACFLCSAYIDKKHAVLLAGPCGINIANAFSVSLTGKSAGVLDCSQSYSRAALQKMQDSADEVVIIKNPFNSEWISKIIDELLPAKKQYFFICPIAEEMFIESQEIYNYVLPVLTEVLVSELPYDNFSCGQIEDKSILEIVPEDRIAKNILRKISMRNYTKKRIEEVLQYYYYPLFETVGNYDFAYLLSILPYFYLTQQTEKFVSKMDSEEKVSGKMKKYIKEFLGASDE